ncbi:serine aminopeptidase domain-containing protein [Winogradskyella aurantiaca]|uniref:serine aminopeptidase domain-containing protein n=1 Tax=Winogradskyella aurantiaca TaxID=2219558 RepID=UPI000E1CA044|nr:alpha/beta hydrolase [Winogradskyella aurantiaca]
MTKLQFSCLFFLLISSSLTGQNYTSQDVTINIQVDGTVITVPGSASIAILIGGSGPIDRNGNQNFSKNNYLKKLAIRLADLSISSLRYDKRTVKQLQSGIIDNDTSFDDFITDAKDAISYVKNMNQFEHIYVIGHSQGSLVGMLALDPDIEGFISLNGPAKNIGETIIDQVSKSIPEYTAATEAVIAQLKTGKTTNNYPQALAAAFNIETQPFLISWMAYTPTEVIKTIETKTLIIQGLKDLQIPRAEAEELHRANNNSDLATIKNMNHVLVDIAGDELENYKSYNDTSFKISEGLIEAISAFIK